jgi:sugar lactone lactonase YvrE
VSRIALWSLLLAGVVLVQQRGPIVPVRQAFQTTGFSPTQGPIAGGTIVTISGSGLAGASIALDGQTVAPLSQSDTSITLRMAAHDNGYVVIVVKAADGPVAYYRYLYVPPRLDEIPPGYITTVAGVGTFKGDFGPALAATVDPNNLAFDGQGNLYLAEANFNQVSRITPDGVIERIAGTGVTPTSDRPCCGDGGPALQALIGFPRGVALDGDGNVYIGADDSRIRRVDRRTGIITTIAGNGVRGFSGDGGPAARAQLSISPRLVITNSGLFFLDFDNARIRRIGADGRITTVAGNGTRGFSGDGGPATAASLDLNADSDGTGLAADPNGNLFLIEAPGLRVRRIDGQTGVIATFFKYQATGTPQGITADRDGNVYLSVSTAIVKLSPSGTLLNTWGSAPTDFSPDGTSLDQLHFGIVTGMVLDGAGNLVISDQAAGRIRRMNFSTNRIETIAGDAPSTIGEEGPAVGAAILQMASGDIALTQSGDLLIADLRVRRVNAAGTITTIAGHAFSMQNGRDNVPALNAWNGALALFVGPTDEIDTASFASSALYHIDRQGIARAIVKQSRACDGNIGDGGPAVSAGLCEPWDVARDRDGNVFYADTNNNRIRRVDVRTGIITTAVGIGPPNGFENYYPGKGRFCGDGGPATSACLATPASVAIDADGNLFVSDTMNYRIRRIDRLSGVITTFVTLPRAPFTIRFGPDGYLYTNAGDRIVRFDRAGTLQTIAGTSGRAGFSGDGGPALQATIDRGYAQSAGVAVNSAGDVFFLDAGNRRVRVIKAGAQLAIACPAGQAPASNLASSVSESTVTLTWSAAPGATSYGLEAGSTAGATDLVVYDTGSANAGYVAAGVGVGTYYVRVRAKGICGISAPTNEVIVRVP